MTDGTGNIAPIPTESEMSNIRQLFERAANSIVDASKLAAEVADLRRIVEETKREIETVRNNNKWLDEQLQETRKARDEARSEAHDKGLRLNEANAKIDGLESRSSSQEQTITSLKQEIDSLYKHLDQTEGERDKALALVDRLVAKAEQAQEHLSKVMAVFAPEPKAEEPKAQDESPFQSSSNTGEASGMSSWGGTGQSYHDDAGPSSVSTNVPITDHGNDTPAMQEPHPVQQTDEAPKASGPDYDKPGYWREGVYYNY